MSTPDRAPLEGVIHDPNERLHRLCAAMVESTTEYDWEPGHPHSLPDHLRNGLLTWAADFYRWDRDQ